MDGNTLIPCFEYDEELMVDHVTRMLDKEKERGITIGDPIYETLPTSQEVRKFKMTQRKNRGVGVTRKAASKRKK